MKLFSFSILTFFSIMVVDGGILSAVKDLVGNMLFCNDFFLESSISDALYNINNMVYGQPFLKNHLIPLLKNHFYTDAKKNIKPRKPLVLRFNGPAGVGKSYTAEFLMRSKYFRNRFFFSPSSSLSSNDPHSLTLYKEEVRTKIMHSINTCRRSVFVFDELNDMPPGFFEDLLPLECHSNFNESLFIYISQTDSEAIISATKKFHSAGRSRESFSIKEFLEAMRDDASSGTAIFKTLWKSFINFWDNLSNKNANSAGHIDLYVPFLPLEPRHIRECVLYEVGSQKLRSSEGLFERLLQTIQCDPGKEFCSGGCKLVHSKLPIALHEHDEI